MENQNFKQLLRGALFAATQGNRLRPLSDVELAEAKGGFVALGNISTLPTFNQTPKYSEFTPEFIQARPPPKGIDTIDLGGLDLGGLDLGNLPAFWR